MKGKDRCVFLPCRVRDSNSSTSSTVGPVSGSFFLLSFRLFDDQGSQTLGFTAILLESACPRSELFCLLCTAFLRFHLFLSNMEISANPARVNIYPRSSLRSRLSSISSHYLEMQLSNKSSKWRSNRAHITDYRAHTCIQNLKQKKFLYIYKEGARVERIRY